MRRTLLACVVGLYAWMAAGCIAVSAHETRFGPDSEAVTVNGRVYLINKSTGGACEIDLTQALACEASIKAEDAD